MNVRFNGKEVNTSDNINLAIFLDERGISSQGVAAAVNQNIIPKELWTQTTLNTNDEILIITATQGG